MVAPVSRRFILLNNSHHSYRVLPRQCYPLVGGTHSTILLRRLRYLHEVQCHRREICQEVHEPKQSYACGQHGSTHASGRTIIPAANQPFIQLDICPRSARLRASNACRTRVERESCLPLELLSPPNRSLLRCLSRPTASMRSVERSIILLPETFQKYFERFLLSSTTTAIIRNNHRDKKKGKRKAIEDNE